MPEPSRATTAEKLLRVAVPLGMVALAILVWHLTVTLAQIPRYILPSPVDVAVALYTDWGMLYPALLATLRLTLTALLLALVGGVALAILLVQSR